MAGLFEEVSECPLCFPPLETVWLAGGREGGEGVVGGGKGGGGRGVAGVQSFKATALNFLPMWQLMWCCRSCCQCGGSFYHSGVGPVASVAADSTTVW